MQIRSDVGTVLVDPEGPLAQEKNRSNHARVEQADIHALAVYLDAGQVSGQRPDIRHVLVRLIVQLLIHALLASARLN